MTARAGRISVAGADATGDAQAPARKPVSVLVVDPDVLQSEQLRYTLARNCALVETAESAHQAEALCQRCHFDVFVVALSLSGSRTLEWLQVLRDRGERSDVVLTADYADLDIAISALRSGASDLLVRPFRDEQLLDAIQRCLRRRRQLRENFLARSRSARPFTSAGLIGESAVMREVLEVIERVARTASTLLLLGETGTGKELIARAIHQRSERKGQFVAVNCGAIPSELLDSELFGHLRGAFTGANTNRDGLFVCADNGSIFLDEIGELPWPMQANLLRVLEERRVRPVGGNQERAVNCRVIAASNMSLDDKVQAGEFREDLHFRLNVLPIQVPPLRERVEDLPLLIAHFVRALAPELGAPPLHVSSAELQRLQEYHWPGNVRELRNLVERALLLGKPLLECCEWAGAGSQAQDPAQQRQAFAQNLSLSEVSKRHVLNVLESVGGNKSEAARRLRISRKTLERKIHVWNHEH